MAPLAGITISNPAPWSGPPDQAIASCAPADFAAYLNLVHPDDREHLVRRYHLAVQRCERLDLPHRLLHANGDVRQVLITALPQCHGQESTGQVLGTLTDTTTHHTLLQNAEQIRLRDPLTDLPNKIATLEWLERQLRGRSHSANLTIVSLDIDGFREINDSFGHATGDRLLRTFATVLVSQLAAEAWVGRLGSDEFVVIYHRGSAPSAKRFTWPASCSSSCTPSTHSALSCPCAPP